MKIMVILLGVKLGLLTSNYSLDLGFKNHNKKTLILSAIVISLFTFFTYYLYYIYGFTNYFISLEITTWFLLLISIYDIKYKQVPMDVVMLTVLLGVVLLYFNPNVTLIESLVGVGIGGVLVLVSYFTKGAIGMGDAFVIGTIGILLGYKIALAVLLYTLVLCGLIGIFLMTFKKANRKTKIPMVPFMFIALLGIVLMG
jgi:leader peptidase (prepilin peptidase)/N-methyltransferase